jgi:tRNA threonylcarbamoyladenosine biosynthesis protein TsaE
MAAEEYTYVSRNPEETASLAQMLAGRAEPGTVIALDGDLGAGKTTFSQHFAKALGVKETVNSPTFTLIKEYEGSRMPFYHMDVYRISVEEADELGLDEYFYGEGVTLVEWASQIAELLPADRLHIRIEYAGGTERIFRVAAHGSPYGQWCADLKQSGVLR